MSEYSILREEKLYLNNFSLPPPPPPPTIEQYRRDSIYNRDTMHPSAFSPRMHMHYPTPRDQYNRNFILPPLDFSKLDRYKDYQPTPRTERSNYSETEKTELENENPKRNFIIKKIYESIEKSDNIELSNINKSSFVIVSIL